MEGTAQIAAAVGMEIAKVVGEKLGEAIRLAAGDGFAQFTDRLDHADQAISRQSADLDSLRQSGGYCEARLADQDLLIQDLRGQIEILREEVPAQAALPAGNPEEVSALRQENEELRTKLTVLESELIRLRKDRREMEKFLLEKINAKG